MKEKTRVYKQVKGCCERKSIICQTSRTEAATYIITKKTGVNVSRGEKESGKLNSEQIICEKLPHDLLLRLQ